MSSLLNGAVHYLDTGVLTPLVGQHCAHRLLELDLSATSCIKLFISKGLGIGIVVGGTIVKVPQILKIVSAKSTVGISFASYLLETVAYTISLAYNYRSGNPFSTFGEMGFITLQNIAILFLILSYAKSLPGLVLFLTVYSIAAFSLFTPSIISPDLLRTLQWATVLIGVASKVPQISNNFTAKSTGQLSAITVFMQTAGSFARVFTTVQEIDDPVLLTSAIVASALNGVIAAQVVVYWANRTPAIGHLPAQGSKRRIETKKRS
ncbi:hypothetical protein HKX48_003978 [Thoreauomyces humboldtii]|nr:hypothetical protein HKX48_003978 [Thoreauomyces humboldtii]